MDFNLQPDELIKALEAGRSVNTEAISKAAKQYNVEEHDIFTNKTKYPDKLVETEEGTSTVAINRIGLSTQKTIVDKAVAFSFARPVSYIFSDEKKAQTIKDILRKNKSVSLTRECAREVYSMTHTAEIWYPVKIEAGESVTGETWRLRVLHLKASKGDVFYPVFENGDMVAFVRDLERKNEEGQKEKVKEIYTAESKITLTNTGSWIETGREKNVIGKIPVAYASQDDTEWSNVQTMIDRMEALVSGHAEVNDYHFAPKLKSSGVIKGFAKKGEKGAIFEMEDNASLEYLTWNQGTESLKLEYDTLRKEVYALTQTPDISFENMMSLGQISGIAAKYFFMDAHLKVEMKREIWDDYLIRRINIIKAYIGKLIDTAQESALDELDIDIQINPYIIDDLGGKIHDFALAKNSNIISLRQIIKMLGVTDDIEAELLELKGSSEPGAEPNKEPATA